MTDSRNDERFLLLLEEHRRILYKVASNFCREQEDRRDLVQEMVIQLWRSFPRYDESFKFSTWMYRVAMNVAISFSRGERRRRRDEVPIDDPGVIELVLADRQAPATDELRTLQQLIIRLDEMSRALIILYLDGYTHEEIGGIVGISPTNVGTRITRIKQRLQDEHDAMTKGDDHESR